MKSNTFVSDLMYVHNNILGYNQYIVLGGNSHYKIIFCFYKEYLSFNSMKNVYKYKILK